MILVSPSRVTKYGIPIQVGNVVDIELKSHVMIHDAGTLAIFVTIPEGQAPAPAH
jgi:hypothetical protein